ncbi:hypothetical protein GOM49_13385 [Clostridium bovifaecis]|uniref:Uncharacterized protein n=1 Tax=Clostridium bovifaecis TaxID=2184719 RepID=A0A6I6F0B3_9CLOT|nr:hypothetical protein GOM49_13385 [Clostridium bovifaecis]
MLEKINDLLASRINEDEAFNEAVSSLDDMDELVENLKRASKEKIEEDIFKTTALDKKHIIAYIVAAEALLFGLMSTRIVYLQSKEMISTLGTLMPFTMVSVVLFMYFGLTQETKHSYGMRLRRALMYCLATVLLMFGAFSTGFVYFSGQELFSVLATSMPFVIISVIVFIYLGLTEKNRRKMDEAWQKQWIQYYFGPQSMMIRGNISGALWIFSFAAFLLIGFTTGWKFSWIVFVVAIGFEENVDRFV